MSVKETVEARCPSCGEESSATVWRSMNVTQDPDDKELLLAGATAVQIGTAIAQKELRLFRTVASGIQNYLEEKGYKKVKEIVGLSHRC